MAILEQEDGFIASKSQFKKKFQKWALNVKYVKGDTMIEIVRTGVKRKRWEGKESMFTVKGNLVASQKINRFTKRKNLSEEELLSLDSLIDAPCPDFRVSTPRPDIPSNVRVQVAHSRRDPTSPLYQSTSLVFSSDSKELDEALISNQLALSNHQDFAPWTSDTSLASTISYNQSPTLMRHNILDHLPPHLPNRPESPELLLKGFRDRICPMLSTAGGQNNLWDTLVLRLVHNQSQSLFEAISAITALQIATDSQLIIHGIESLCKSLATLQPEVLGQTPCIITTLATVLLLAFWTRWDQGLHTGKLHIMGASRLLAEVCSRYREGSLELSPSYSYSLLAFLHDTCSRMDSLSRVVRSAMATDQYEASTLPAFEELHPERSLPGDSLTDPWMGCVRRLFPLISRTADLCNEARSASINSPAIMKKAVALKCEIEAWRPDTEMLYGTDHSPTDRRYIDHTAEAYRYATLLYLDQVVPKLAGDCQQMSGNIVGNLDSVPPDSRITLVHTFPLFVAGCEACTKEERKWVEERWDAMRARTRVRNAEKCWEIIQEVWRRRDKYRQERNRNSTDHQQAMFDCSGEILKEMDSKFLVWGELHWARVMKEWEWEVSF